jgi:hemoglobin
MEAPLYQLIGEEPLRAVVTDFYRRVFDDVMIGFLFIGKDRQRLIDKECEFTARFLGATTPYTGRPMREAHARSPIMGGHFDRRLTILRQTLADHQIHTEVAEAWLDHQMRLRHQVTRDAASQCTDTRLLHDPD